MKSSKALYIALSCILVGAISITAYHRQAGSKPGGPAAAGQTVVKPSTETAAVPQSEVQVPQDVAYTISSFLGTQTPGGSNDSANRVRTYVVSYQVAFLRKSAAEKLPEESMTYRQLQDKDGEMPPNLFYGENVIGQYDPTHPDAILVRTIIDQKAVEGYVDAAKLWLEPPLTRGESDRYMVIPDNAAIHVVPDAASPPVLSILQGEVVDVVGQLDFMGQKWIKARFNVTDRPRYGFILANEMKALNVETVNQSVVAVDEVPKVIRSARLEFSPTDRQMLSQAGFYVEPLPAPKDVGFDDMVDAYYNRKAGEQKFVTSDLYLHCYHLVFDRMLQDIEEKKMLPAVSKMSAALASEAEIEANAASSPTVQNALLSDLLYFSVAAKLFDPGFAVPATVRSQADDFVSRIQAADGELPSQKNFLGLDKEDFTQYKVRGHYEKNDNLKHYFRGMMWFGRRTFLLSDKTQTLAAILLPSIIEQAHETKRFENVDALATYLIGRQDKYTLAGYRGVNKKVFGAEAPGIRQIPSNLDETIATFERTAWSSLPQPQIVSTQTGAGLSPEERLRQSAGLKFLGQRYVLDAFIMNQLTSPNLGSDANPRNLPSALDVMMLLGSRPATEMQRQEALRHQWPNYDRQIQKLTHVADEQLGQRATFYENWLSTLKTLFTRTQSKQLFALSEPWQYKSLNTGLASWTELKHDTILYAEQSAAEQGGGDVFEIPSYAPPAPKGYVEPNPALFKQLVDLTDQMLAELKQADLITEEYLDKFTLFRQLAHQAEVIARKEVNGEPISREEYQWIENIQFNFDRTLLFPRDYDTVRDKSLLQMALVADVATDAFGGKVLEEGIGTPHRIIVLAKDAFGGTRLTVGNVYSWYEFSSDHRWSDTEWKNPIYANDENTKQKQGIVPPAWYSNFVKGQGSR